MTPTHYTLDNGIYTFHYKFSDLRKFLDQGHKTGDVGQIIISGNSEWNKYRGFGLIENPCTRLLTFDMKRCDEFTGTIFDPDAIVNPKPLDIKWGILMPAGKNR